MTRDEFKTLKIGDYFHDPKQGDEWKVEGIFIKHEMVEALCTKSGIFWKECEITKWHISACFALGRHPSNLPQPTVEQPAELFVNVYEQEGEFYTGDSAFNSAQKAYDSRDELSTYRYTAKLVPVVIEQPYTPKHGEKCRIEVVNTTTNKGKILECTALHLEGNIHAFVSLSDAANGGFYQHSEIKRFLPL